MIKSSHQNKKNSLKIILLLFAHLLILNVLFVYRYPPLEVEPKFQSWKKGELGKNPLNYIKFYFSPIRDESYYYEWSTLVLGKTFEENYLLPENRFKSLKNYFSEKPEIRMPYRDIPFEYPPLLIIPILLARLLSSHYLQFTQALAAIISITYLGCLGILYKIWKRNLSEKKSPFPTILLFSSLSLISLGALYVTRLDVFPSLLCLMALFYFMKEKYYFATLFIAFGFFTKAYPILLAPLFAIILIEQRKFKTTAMSALFLMGVVCFMWIGIEWLTQGHYSEALKFHSQRGIQIESIYSFIPLIAHLFFRAPVFVSEGYGSLNFHLPTLSYWVKLSSVFSLVGFFSIYLLFWRKLKTIFTANSSTISEGTTTHQTNIDVSLPPLIHATLLILFTFILTFKVLSPQFLIWLTPLIFIAETSHRKYFFFLFLFTLFLSQMIFPNLYSLLEEGNPIAISLLFLRNIFLLVLFGWLLKDFLRLKI